MNAIGIVAEYNPFHTGHGYQIGQSRTVLGQDRPVIAVMSGNWVQQADCAIADKWARARLALSGGADLVLELPTLWATASAERFARGAVELLSATGVVEYLSFGSECGEIAPLVRAAACLDSPACRAALQERTGSGLPFAVCRQQAVEEVEGAEIGQLLSTPNNNLGIEYIRALNALQSSIHPFTVRREGAAHNSLSDSDEAPRFVSATRIRRDLRGNDFAAALPYLAPGGADILREAAVFLPDLNRAERSILGKMRAMTAADWAKLPDSGEAEGLPKRLEKAGRTCRSLADFYEQTKTRRYTHARLRRLVLWAYLSLERDHFIPHPPYLRVLAFNERGRDLLRQMKERASLPIITKPAHVRKLDEASRRLFELEARCTDLYDLCAQTIPAPGREYTTDPVRVGGIELG